MCSRYYLYSEPTVELTRDLFVIVERQYNNSCFSSCLTHLQLATTHINLILNHDLPFQKLDKLHWLPGSGGRELPLHHQPGADLYRYICRRRYLDLYRYTKLSRHLYPYLYLPPPGDGVAAGGLAGLAPGLADDVRVVAQVSRYLLSMSIRFNLQYLQPPVSPHHGPRAHVPVPGSQQRGLAPLVRCDTWHVTREHL